MAAIFIPQSLCDTWDIDGKITLAGELLTITSDGTVFNIEPAVRFTKSVGQPGDPLDLIGTVRRRDDLASLGGEHYLGSVVLGEEAYEVDEGFCATPVAG